MHWSLVTHDKSVARERIQHQQALGLGFRNLKNLHLAKGAKAVREIVLECCLFIWTYLMVGLIERTLIFYACSSRSCPLQILVFLFGTDGIYPKMERKFLHFDCVECVLSVGFLL